MSSQITNNNTYYTMAPTSPNPYISKKLNNMEEARMMKKERNDWTKMYHKTLKGLEAMIDVQKQVRHDEDNDRNEYNDYRDGGHNFEG